MRFTMLLVLVSALSVGCVTEPTATSEDSSELSYSFYSPRLAVVARITKQRTTADDLRAHAAASKPPTYSTWAVLTEYRTAAQFAYDTADKLDGAADTLEAELATTTNVAALDTESQLRTLQMTSYIASLSETFAFASSLIKRMHETSKALIDNLDDG